MTTRGRRLARCGLGMTTCGRRPGMWKEFMATRHPRLAKNGACPGRCDGRRDTNDARSARSGGSPSHPRCTRDHVASTGRHVENVRDTNAARVATCPHRPATFAAPPDTRRRRFATYGRTPVRRHVCLARSHARPNKHVQHTGSDGVVRNSDREQPARRQCAAAINRRQRTACRSDTVADAARSVIDGDRPIIDEDS